LRLIPGIFVGVQHHPRIGFVEPGAQLHVVFVETGAHSYVVFVHVEAHTAFVGLRLCLHIFCVGTARGLGQHGVMALSTGLPAFLFPLCSERLVGRPSLPFLYSPLPSRAAQAYGVVNSQINSKYMPNKSNNGEAKGSSYMQQPAPHPPHTHPEPRIACPPGK
jgi:hypothetical protein